MGEEQEREEERKTESEESEEKEKEQAEKTEEELIKEKTKKITGFLKKSNWIFYVILAFILWLNVKIRSAPIPRLRDITTNSYTLGPDLDPFLFLRYAKYIAEYGKLMVNDTMRYVPLGYNTTGETKLLPYMIAYLYKFLNLFSETTVEYVAIIFPVVFSVFTTIFFFLLVRKIFEAKGKKISNIIALVGTAFLVVLPSLLPRTIAGIPEKESAGFGLMFAAFYFFLCAWKSKSLNSGIILGILAGIFTGLMGLIWGAWIFIFISIAISVFLVFMFNKIRKKEFIVYFIWLILAITIPLLFTERYTVKGLLASTSSGLATVVFLILFIDFLIFNTKIKNLNFIEKLRKKIPDRVVSLLFGFIIIFIFSSILFGILFIPNSFLDIARQLTKPLTGRHAYTVAENRQPYFDEWKGSFGPIFYGLPLFFWLFFIGSIFLFYEMINIFRKKDKYILTSIYTIFLFCLIFSRSSAGSVFNGTNTISKTVYFGGMLLLVGSLIYFYYKYYKNNEEDLFKKINYAYLFLFILFFISLIAARSAVRLIMVLAPVGSIIMAYFVVSVTENVFNKKEELMKIIIVSVTIIVVLATIYTFYAYYRQTSAMAPNYAPSAYNVQWQKAMAWVRENTQEEAVFGHWWDYGYWLQTIGERATMLDGGNAIGYWNYLMGRHVLTAESEDEALEVLYAHNVTHYLIDSTEIGKYSAYSNIGSDENYDRFSWIGTFLLNEQATRETKTGTSYFYQGGTALDEDFLYKNEETGEQVFIPARGAGVGALSLKTRKETNQTVSKQPEAVFIYQGRQINIPLRYLYYDKLYDFGDGYEGGLYVFPRVIQQGEGIRVDDKGAALFLSERNMRALWVRLYLIGEGEKFELVHTEPNLFVESLRNQGLEIGNIVFYQGIQGPIKIWKINYTGKEKINEKYLQTDWPEEIKQRAFV